MRDWLRDKRKSKRLTQADVAERVGIARTTYASYEQGERDPSIRVAAKIGDLLQFKWVLFFEDELHETRNKKSAV